MKKTIFFIITTIILSACSSNDEPGLPACQPTIVEDFDEASTFYNFENGDDGNQRLGNISVYEGTDSAYVYTYSYTADLIDKISQTDNGQVTNYTAVYDGDKLVKLQAMAAGSGIVEIEMRMTYTGNNIAEWQGYILDINTSNFYQFYHQKFSYESDGNLKSYDYYFDIAMLFTVGLGTTPTEPYTPEHFFTIELGYGSQDAPNPLYGQYNLFRPEMATIKNIPTTMVQKDANGAILGSLGYTITFNEQGFPTLADAVNSFIDITYICE